MERENWYRKIPKVDAFLEGKESRELIARYGREPVTEALREECRRFREAVAKGESEEALEKRLSALPARVCLLVEEWYTPRFRRVINATGTVLHTNLGRAPLSREQMEQLAGMVSGYSNLEYELEEGRRGERYSHFEDLLCTLTGAEAAMAVNNNAAAVLLILSALARGGEVVVSRGELVEIGGKFRVPDVIAESGARQREVGTTNKTHLEDYARALGEETRAILKVHQSNFRILGFTEEVELAKLAKLGQEKQVPVIADLGSGVLVPLELYGLPHEPTVQEALAAGADVVCFSGDKLLGGPQAGIIVGKKEYLSRLKKHPLARAVRMDKFTACALELVLREYRSLTRAVKRIPALRMCTQPAEEIRGKVQRLFVKFQEAKVPGEFACVPCISQVGGGAMPEAELKSFALSIRPKGISVSELERQMRELPVPIIGRISGGALLLDLRTVQEEELSLLAEEFRRMQQGGMTVSRRSEGS